MLDSPQVLGAAIRELGNVDRTTFMAISGHDETGKSSSGTGLVPKAHCGSVDSSSNLFRIA
jgi:hypothetical protein